MKERAPLGVRYRYEDIDKVKKHTPKEKGMSKIATVKGYSVTDPSTRETGTPTDYSKEFINPSIHGSNKSPHASWLRDHTKHMNDVAGRRALLHISYPAQKRVVRVTDENGKAKLYHRKGVKGSLALQKAKNHKVWDSWYDKQAGHYTRPVPPSARTKNQQHPYYSDPVAESPPDVGTAEQHTRRRTPRPRSVV
jgi:hypothetical protein